MQERANVAEMSYLINANLRRRVRSADSIEQVHLKLREAGADWFVNWNVDLSPLLEVPQVGFDELGVDIRTEILNGDGVIDIRYVLRNERWNRDEACHDDFVIIKMNSPSHYHEIARTFMMDFAENWGAYRGRLTTDMRLALDDWDVISEARRNGTVDVDGRDSVYRFHPVMLFDRELCQRAFGMSHEEVAEKVEGICELVEVTDERVLVAASLQPLEREDILEYDGRMKRALGVSESADQ